MAGCNRNLKDKRRISAQSIEWNPLVHSGAVPYLFHTMAKKELRRLLGNVIVKIQDFNSARAGLEEDDPLLHHSIAVFRTEQENSQCLVGSTQKKKNKTPQQDRIKMG